ncbi:Fur family transcriptional regulator [Pseudothauera rhizosphaerae]|uniref:Transcriptional repressor n=1 Tax=Pseudothauera rhizosphaerae TaxID=2565932 RepID=A0A4S4AYW7_9RHOO|nr:Fur family transcriptional regulator [Pseudothauera rhizosphaerae]THF65356.1 transcriptional repressor [Pseudothauera rhizosphaerae]
MAASRSRPPPAPPAASPAQALIAAHGRVTRTRVAVLDSLLASHQPLNHDQIAAELAATGEHHDRVTVYRALDWLVEQGIAARIAGSDRAWKFEAVRRGHRHAHFHCDTCGRVLCLEAVEPAIAVALPEGFRLEQAELVLRGACPDCARNGER